MTYWHKNLSSNKEIENISSGIEYDLCRKYLSVKDLDYKFMIILLSDKIKEQNFSEQNITKSMNEWISHIKKNIFSSKSKNPSEYENSIMMEKYIVNVEYFLSDLNKLKKIIEKKEIKTNTLKLINICSLIVKEEVEEITNMITRPAYIQISRVTKTNKFKIVKQFKKLYPNCFNYKYVKNLLELFKISCSDKVINNLILKCNEETEIEQFEATLGLPPVKHIEHFDDLNGLQFEEYLEKLFKLLGYDSIKTKSTGDQGADLLIKKDNEKIVVQAKKYNGSVTNKAIQEVVASISHYGADRGMVVTTGNFTISAIELAKSNKVELWDKNKLTEVINNLNQCETLSSQNKSTSPTQHKIVEDDDDSIKVICYHCKSEITVNLTDLPKRYEKNKEIPCPVCLLDFAINIDEQGYICKICKKEFDSIEDHLIHSKICSIHE